MLDKILSAGGGILGSIAGSWLTSRSNEKAAEKNAALQREMAKNGLSWRIADAKRAGINPLAALGASLPTGQPVAVGTDYGDLGLGKAGQDIGRAMKAKMTPEQREIHELNKEMLRVKIDGQKIDNENARNIGTGPPLPTPDYTGSPQDVLKSGVTVKPAEVTAAKQRGVEAGLQAFYTDAIDDSGEIWRVPSKELTEVIESSLPAWFRHNITEGGKILESLSNIITTPAKRKAYGDALRKVRPPSPRPGWEFRWVIPKARWKLVQMEEGGRRTQIFLNSSYDGRKGVKRYKIERN